MKNLFQSVFKTLTTESSWFQKSMISRVVDEYTCKVNPVILTHPVKLSTLKKVYKKRTINILKNPIGKTKKNSYTGLRINCESTIHYKLLILAQLYKVHFLLFNGSFSPSLLERSFFEMSLVWSQIITTKLIDLRKISTVSFDPILIAID